MQIIALVINEDPVGLSGAEIRALAKELRHTGISEKHQQLIRETTEYLNQTLPDKMKELRKVHVPMIFKMAIQAKELGIPPLRFGGWMQNFFAPKNYKSSGYKDFARSKTADKTNVVGRLFEMQRDFDENIETSLEWKRPEPGVRGRRPGTPNKPKEQTNTETNTDEKSDTDVA